MTEFERKAYRSKLEELASPLTEITDLHVKAPKEPTRMATSEDDQICIYKLRDDLWLAFAGTYQIGQYHSEATAQSGVNFYRNGIYPPKDKGFEAVKNGLQFLADQKLHG